MVGWGKENGGRLSFLAHSLIFTLEKNVREYAYVPSLSLIHPFTFPQHCHTLVANVFHNSTVHGRGGGELEKKKTYSEKSVAGREAKKK